MASIKPWSAPAVSDISPKISGVLPALPGAMPMSDAIAAPDMIREMVQAHRPSGLDRAYAAVARLCGISPRRVRGYWHGEATDPRQSESCRIRDGYAAWITAETRRLDARRALLEARLDALRTSHASIHSPGAGAAAAAPCPPADGAVRHLA